MTREEYVKWKRAYIKKIIFNEIGEDVSMCCRIPIEQISEPIGVITNDIEIQSILLGLEMGVIKYDKRTFEDGIVNVYMNHSNVQQNSSTLGMGVTQVL